jgi:hypothetical protein
VDDLPMKDYAKIETKEPFKWGEAIISALLLPSIFLAVILLKVAAEVLK